MVVLRYRRRQSRFALSLLLPLVALGIIVVRAFQSPNPRLLRISFEQQRRTTLLFAYAPNFITKIIEQTTGLTPVGLLDVATTPSPTSSATDDDVPSTSSSSSTTKFVRPITTRFPPEPNGYLHLGHAKAVSFNFAVARAFTTSEGTKGRCHMRLDDTNPSKEDDEYARSILEDVRWIQRDIIEPSCERGMEDNDKTIALSEDLGPWYGGVRKTSDYFSLIYDAAMYLIQNGEAYIDELSAEEMRDYRGTLTEPGRESPYRTRPILENIDLFTNMKAGKYSDGTYVLRAKIDMSSPNINMRDPVLYRIKHESHQATGDEWCIYPMYDFSHPIADAVEGITHSLCTLEFEDHRPLYDWVAERMVQAKLVNCLPRQIEFSRLNLKYTVLSKRKLIKLVEDGYVNGWDDPRMPTICGLRRRGVPPSAIRLFCERMGISKSDSNIDFDVLEDCAREVLDEESCRAFVILCPIKVTITNWKEGTSLEHFDIPRHPKRSDLGHRTVPFGKSIYIERSDFFDVDGPEGRETAGVPPAGFKRLLPDGKVRLKYAYVIQCDKIIRDTTTHEPIELLCTYSPETKAGATPPGEARVKGIIQWVEASTSVKCRVMQYDRLFIAEDPGKESGDFANDINKDSLKMIENVIVEPSVSVDAKEVIRRVRNNDDGGKMNLDKPYHSDLAYQFERIGYFALDSSSTDSDLVFNRVVTLKDTWNAASSESVNDRKTDHQPTHDLSKNKNGGGSVQVPVVEDARRIALRAGTILEAGPHSEAESLIVCKLDCGDVDDDGEPLEPRTVVAGLAGKISFEELINRRVVCLTNLKPAKMRGVESTAMLLAASNGKEGEDEVVQLLDVPESVSNGELLFFEDMEPCEPDAMLKSKGAMKVWDRVQARLRINENGEATYLDKDNNSVVRKILTSHGPVKAKSLKNCMIG